MSAPAPWTAGSSRYVPEGTRVLVVGFRMTGQAVAGVLMGLGARVLAVDDKPTERIVDAARERDVMLLLPEDFSYLESFGRSFDLVVVSPGIPHHHPALLAARESSVPVVSEIELAFRLLEERPSPRPELVAITGTNGKTTVTTWVTGILSHSKLRPVAAGNVGSPLVGLVTADVDVLVAEVSSFQLDLTRSFRPRVSCWLNFSANHLDFHANLEEYAIAKSRVWVNQGPGDLAVVNADDTEVMARARSLPDGVRLVTFSVSGAGDFVARDGRLWGPEDEPILSDDALPRSLPHDKANALAAAATAVAAGADLAACRDGLRNVSHLPHRVELVAEAGGVRWYDDSKSTTPQSVLVAVSGFQSVVLIAGGRNKGLDLSELSSATPAVKAVVAIGESAVEIAKVFAGKAEVRTAASMEEAVRAASKVAKEGDAVLLSPGAASYDWYSSYVERGEHFSEIVRSTVQRGGG